MKDKFLGAIAMCMLFAAPRAVADDWGCEVLLCMANPSGPTAVAQCVPAITKLWRALAKGHPFPTCQFKGPSTTYARSDVATPQNCPPQFIVKDGSRQAPRCGMDGVITTISDGKVIGKAWWSQDGKMALDYRGPGADPE